MKLASSWTGSVDHVDRLKNEGAQQFLVAPSTSVSITRLDQNDNRSRGRFYLNLGSRVFCIRWVLVENRNTEWHQK